MNNVINWINQWSLGGKLSILWFIPAVCLVLYGAIKLVKYAEVIMVKTKIGGAFVGGALIAAVTSIPELITEVAQSSSGNPGAGFADDIGSNAFSAFLLGISAIVFVKTMFLKKLGRWSRISIFISFALAFVLTFVTYFQKDLIIGNAKFAIGIVPLLLFIVYLLVLRWQYKFGDSDEENEEAFKHPDISVKRASWMFLYWGIFLIIFSLLMNWFASSMQAGYSEALNSKTVGGIFLSVATSMPEVVAFFILLRKNKPVAAIASLIGSHIFNIAISFFGDLAYHGEYDGTKLTLGDAPTMTTSGVHDNWPLALITAIMMGLLVVQVIISKKITKKRYYLVIPSLVTVTYIVGWTCMLAL